MSISDDDLLAAEYAVGLMEPAAAEAFAARLSAEPGLAAAVDRWRARLVDLDLAAVAEPPGEALWSRISASLDAAPPAQPMPAGAASPTTAAAAAAGRAADIDRRSPAAAGGEVVPLRRRVAAWRTAALAAAAASLVLAVVAARLILVPPEPVLLAVLVGAEGAPGAVVQVFPDGAVSLVSLSGLTVPEGRALEVWTQWNEAQGPVSVGLLERAQSAVLAMRGLPLPRAEQFFAISLEPAGGSPTGKPTGPILFKGTATPTL